MKKIALSGAFLLLTGCSWIHNQHMVEDQKKTYDQTTPLPSIQLPASFKSSAIGSNTKPLPNIDSQGTLLKQTPLPPGSLPAQIASGEVSANVLKQKLPKL